LILASALAAMVLLFVYGLASYSYSYSYYNPMLLSLGGWIVVFLIAVSMSYELTTVDTDPKTTLTDLAHRLRVSKYRVKEDKKGLKVQVTSSTVIRITANTVQGRTVVGYRPDQTASGWTAIIILIFMCYLAAVGAALAVYSVWQVQRFAREWVLPRIEGAKPIAEETPGDMVRSTLIDGLSEGYRLASEAYEAQHSNYQDGVMAVITGTIFVWFLTFFSLLAWMKDQPLYQDVQASLAVSLVAAIAFCVPLMFYLGRRVRIKASDFKSWSARLFARLEQETRPEPPKDLEPSVFELLDEVSKQIPKWMKVMRKAGMFTNPWTWFTIFMLGYLAFMLFLIGISWSPQDLTIQSILVVGGLATTLCCFLLYVRWRAEQREEESMVTKDWESRLRIMNGKMQRHLEEL